MKKQTKKKISFIGKLPAKRKIKKEKNIEEEMEEPEQEDERLMEEPAEIKALENQKGIIQIGFDEEKPEKPQKPEIKPKTAEIQAIGSPAKRDLAQVDIKIPSLEAQSERKLEEEVRMLRIKKLEAEKRKLEAELQENNTPVISENIDDVPSIPEIQAEPEKKKYPPLPLLSESLIPETKPMPLPIIPETEKPVIPSTSKNVMIPTISEVFNPKNKEQEIFLTSPDSMLIKICPLCKSKVKRTKVQEINNFLIQDFRCKNKKCDFTKRIVARI